MEERGLRRLWILDEYVCITSNSPLRNKHLSHAMGPKNKKRNPPSSPLSSPPPPPPPTPPPPAPPRPRWDDDDDESIDLNELSSSFIFSFFDSPVGQPEEPNLWQDDSDLANISLVISINVTKRSTARDARRAKRMTVDYMLNVEASTRQCASYRTNAPKKIAKTVDERSQNAQYSDSQRLQALVLWKAGIAKNIAVAFADVKNVRCFKRWLKIAEERGYDRNTSKMMTIEMVQVKAKSGRPIVCGFAQQEAIIASGKNTFRSFDTFYLQICSDCRQKRPRKTFCSTRL